MQDSLIDTIHVTYTIIINPNLTIHISREISGYSTHPVQIQGLRLYYPNARMRERHATNMYVSDNMIIGTRGFQYDLDLTDLATLGQAEPLQYPFKGETNLH